MGDSRCLGCTDPITKFIELHRNPLILCVNCRNGNSLVPINSSYSTNQTSAAPTKKQGKKSAADLWNSLLKNTYKLLRSFSSHFSNLKISKIKGMANMMDKLKRIYEKSNEKGEIVKAVRYLYKMEATTTEKLKYLKDHGGIYEELASFYENLEIFIESYLFYDRNLQKQ